MKKKICIIAALCSSAAVVLFTVLALHNSHEKLLLTQRLAEELIRFHVRANSDSSEDQELKLKVRDAVIEYLEPLLEDSASIDESRSIISKNEIGIKAAAQNVILGSGYDYDVKAYFERSHFPTRTYGDITLPAGVYEAYRIDIGEAAGHNWWCVLYPPLCFEDATHAVMTEKSKDTLKQALTPKEYETITKTPQKDKESQETEVKVRFRIFKFLNKYIAD